MLVLGHTLVLGMPNVITLFIAHPSRTKWNRRFWEFRGRGVPKKYGC